MVVEIPYTSDREPKIELVEFNGAKFKTVTWPVPEGVEYKGKIIYVHGFAEDSTIYVEFFDRLSKSGYEVFFFDQRGAGETSPGDLVGKTDEQHVRGDLDFFIKRNLDAREDSSEKFYLFGHSMGAGIILNYGVWGKYKQDIKGIVACGPLIKLHPNSEPNIVVRGLGPVINKLVPGLKVDSKLNYDYITSNLEWKNYIEAHSGKLVGTIRQFYDMLERGKDLNKKEYVARFSPDIAVLIVHGTDDKINWIKGSETFLGLLSDKVDKEFYPAPNGRHSLFIESEAIYSGVYERVSKFLANH